jgi:hypothetical protein
MISASKITKSLLLGIAMVLLSTAVAFAATTGFSKKYVDSNTYGDIVSGKKDKAGSVATAYISKIYKADGKDSSYSCVKVKVKNGSGEYTSYKKTSCDMALYPDYQVKGKSLTLRAKGNNPFLDCMISGDFNAH